jgi:hypothetical protein
MTIRFKYGFEYGGFLYGWKNHDLYRLPSTSGNKLYGLKKLSLITVGNGSGYHIKRQKFSITQLRDRTTEFAEIKTIKIINDTKDLPV